MMKLWKSWFTGERGITLIELLVVVVILGVIAAITIPMVITNQKDAYVSANKQNAQIINEAIQRYAIDNGGNYPGSLEVLTQRDQTTGKGPWLKEIPPVFDQDGKEEKDAWVDQNGTPISSEYNGTIEKVQIPQGYPGR